MTFGSLTTFFGGLDGLIGMPQLVKGASGKKTFQEVHTQLSSAQKHFLPRKAS